ncbi:virulence factor SrfB [Tropicimonas sp. S265A]|uniref:virulence factor SrfB n=1 Tax=Tropicimonas sp. S265A TaxID=3415134 RepID=UPI003C7E700A
MLQDRAKRLRKLVNLGDEVTLVPYSGIQILDFGFDINALDIRSFRFIERPEAGASETHRTLYPLTGDADKDSEILEGVTSDDTEYSVRPVAALEPFLEKWVPVPVLRLKNQRGAGGEELYDAGPSSWARMRTVELAEPDADTGHTHRVQIALDTALTDQDQSHHYVAPERADSEKPREFRLVSDPASMSWFLQRLEADDEGNALDLQLWVSDWLKEMFLDFKRAERPGRAISEENLPYMFEHWARYLSYLRLIERAVAPPKMRFANTVAQRDAVTPVKVDLVLDIGNSRTCGILIERFPGDTRVDLARSFPLEIRDLSRPEYFYSGLFESRVEFADLRFGDERYASRSGRRNAFMWPSFVRMGPEAMRLVQSEEGTETLSGLSSPKRYLWDDTAVQQDWRFHNHFDPNNLPRPVRAAMRHLNEAGDVLVQIKQEISDKLRVPKKGVPMTPAIRPRFSRSSLFGFMLAEVIAHAMVQINDPASRSRRPQSDLPRFLNRIILSLPTATSVQEQAMIRSRVQGAMTLVKEMLGIKDGSSTIAVSEKPELLVDWDEASCTQLVYLYSEVTQKFEGRIDTFLDLKGKPRKGPDGAEAASLRLACIDVGGGTTDLMITTYRGEDNKVLHPEQTFREGFRVAGDDLVHRVISAIVLPRLEDAVTEGGGRFVAERMRELFGGDIGGQEQQTVQRRRQFSVRVLVPLAEAILSRCEDVEEADRIDVPVAEILGLIPTPDAPLDGEDQPDSEEAEVEIKPKVTDDILDYLEKPAAQCGAEGWRLADVTLSVSREDLDAIAREVFQKVLGNMCEVIDHLGCDVVLLTGRPSRLPAVRAIVEEMLVVPPHRLISMHRYKTGNWYPFRDPVSQRVGDPKSTVAVGGMLIALSESQIPNFKVTTGAFQMKSTARFVGEMDTNGQIPEHRILFEDIDLDAKKTAQDPTAMIKMYSPVFIGSRQLPLERWTTTPLYRLDFANSSIEGRKKPLQIELVREDDDVDEAETSLEKLRRERVREVFRVDGVEDAEGNMMRNEDVVLSLHTLGFEDEYWLDTGVFRI